MRNEDRDNQIMVQKAYDRVVAKPRDYLEKIEADAARIMAAARRWAQLKQNPKATRVALRRAEEDLIEAAGLTD